MTDVPKNIPYPLALREMAFVPRWSIARTTRKPSIAEHSFFVAMYAVMVADAIELKWTAEARLALVFGALWHDVGEVVTGDMPGPGKRYFVSPQPHQDWIDKYTTLMFGSSNSRMIRNISENSTSEHGHVLKIANLIDEIMFMADEHAMGNKWIWRVAEAVMARLKNAWFELPAKTVVLTREWETLRTAIEAHRNPVPVIPGLD